MNYLSKFKSESELQQFIINRIKFFRTSKNITQAEAAYLLNMSEQNFGRIERGRYKPSIYFILNFCSKFDITLQEFFKFNPNYNRVSKLEKATYEFLVNNKSSMQQLSNLINSFYNNDYN